MNREESLQTKAHQLTTAGIKGSLNRLSDAMRVRAAALLAAGMNLVNVAKVCNVNVRTVKRWRGSDPIFRHCYESFATQQTEVMTETLLLGERKAIATMLEAMSASTPVRKRVKGETKIVLQPDWPTRMRAAERMLDMRGQRGKPVERQEIKQETITGDLTQAITAALADPGMQGYLQRVLVPDAEFEVVEGTEDGPARLYAGADSGASAGSEQGSPGRDEVLSISQETSRVHERHPGEDSLE